MTQPVVLEPPARAPAAPATGSGLGSRSGVGDRAPEELPSTGDHPGGSRPMGPGARGGR